MANDYLRLPSASNFLLKKSDSFSTEVIKIMVKKIRAKASWYLKTFIAICNSNPMPPPPKIPRPIAARRLISKAYRKLAMKEGRT
jgi:hypothetical protein